MWGKAIEKKEEIPEGFQVKASLKRWPSISMSKRIGTKLSAVGLLFSQPKSIPTQIFLDF